MVLHEVTDPHTRALLVAREVALQRGTLARATARRGAGMEERQQPPITAEELVDLEAGIGRVAEMDGETAWTAAYRRFLEADRRLELHLLQQVARQRPEALAAELRRLALALHILAGLPDDAGHTHAAALGDRGGLYARGVLAGADPGDVEGAIRAGGEER